ncbi:hypothetical protein HPP92_024897 [Vanilla planifolia]|uniref:Uncharacterized protein n=1 Tax=Vanilla planifolia TaxID=51239 RepID=A0A835U9W2_VANPL|nr:hypothetical protein HPP92_024897 [Vanilla planifolia]
MGSCRGPPAVDWHGREEGEDQKEGRNTKALPRGGNSIASAGRLLREMFLSLRESSGASVVQKRKVGMKAKADAVARQEIEA